MTNTYGPSYESKIDGKRIAKQHEVIRDYMLNCEWKTLAEIESATGFPQASVSAQLRHMRKEKFGSYRVDKRRNKPTGGTWEYRVRRPFNGELF